MNKKRIIFKCIFRQLQCLIFVISLLFISTSVYAQGVTTSDRQDNTEGVSQEDTQGVSQNFTQSKFHTEYNYFTFPLTAKIGYLYRKNNIGIFPYMGGSFGFSNSLQLKAFPGFALKTKYVVWENQLQYELLPGLQKKEYNLYSVVTSLGFNFAVGGLKLPFSYGNKRFFLENEEKPVIKSFFSAGLQLNAFLFDTGIAKSTLYSSVTVTAIPSSQFVFYQAAADIPLTFYLNAVELAFSYSILYNNRLEIKDYNPIENYSTGQPYEQMTIRIPFVSGTAKYSLLQSFEFEPRWYVLKHHNSHAPYSPFFISAFGNIGMGIEEKTGNAKLLYQVGGGLGYTLFDSVPFTLQAGINQDLQFILFLGVISRISHRP